LGLRTARPAEKCLLFLTRAHKLRSNILSLG